MKNKYLDKLIIISERLLQKRSKFLIKLYDFILSSIIVPAESHRFINIISTKDEVNTIINNFCIKKDVGFDFICKKTRKTEVVKLRQQLHTLLMDNTKLSLASIGLKVGGKNHATVLHSHKTVDNLMDTNKKYRSEFYDLIMYLGLKYIKYNSERIIL